MAKIIQPGERIIAGPLLVQSEDLENLEKIVQIIDDKLNQSLLLEIENSIEDLKSSVPEEKLTRRIEALNARKQFTAKKRTFKLVLDDGNQLFDDSVSGLIKQTEKLNFRPEELVISIGYGLNNSFHLEIVPKDTEAEIESEYRIKCFDEEIKDDIVKEIESWTRKLSPGKLLKMWDKVHTPFTIISILVAVISLLIWGTASETTESYNSTLKNEAHRMISQNIVKDSLAKAVDLLLKLSSNYSPKNYVPKVIPDDTTGARRTFFISLLIGIAGITRPKTIIGIGKNQLKLQLYQYWKWLFGIAIPGGMIYPWVSDWISSHF